MMKVSTERLERSSALLALRKAVEDSARVNEPRYMRLCGAIVEMLANNVWTAGDKLPSEGELARSTGLSLGTVQKALGHLANEQVVIRRHGHGTFISGGVSQSSRLINFRFVADDGNAIAPVYAEAIGRKVVQASGPWSNFLTDSNSFIRVRRRINVAGEFDCISDFYIDHGKFSTIMEMQMQDLHRIIIRDFLSSQFSMPTISVSKRVYASLFSDEIGKLLKLSGPKKSFGMVMEVYSYTHHRYPISFQNIFIPSGVRPLEIPNHRFI